MLRELTDVEKTSALMKYCTMDVKKSECAIPKMNPDNALIPDDINVIIDVEKAPKESGYCMLENGGSYIFLETAMPGVTKEMLQWVIAWHGLEPINYVALNPELHHSAAIGDADREKLMKNFLTVEEKSKGIHVFSVNLVDGELEDTVTSYLSPEDMGLDAGLYAKSGLTVLGGNVLRQYRSCTDTMAKSLNILVSVIEEAEDGVKVKTHLWGGYKLLRRETKRFEVNGIQPTEEYTAMLANYIADELAQLANVLPQIYEEYKDSL